MSTTVRRHLHAGSIVDTIRLPLLLLNEDLDVVTANDAFLRAFGNVREHIEGRSLRDISGGEWNFPELCRRLDGILPAGPELRDFEVEARPDGLAFRTLLLNARRLEHQDSSAGLILLEFDDVTERRRLEQALRTAMAELERSNQELERFASIASHDLQEPLRKIRAFGERLETVCAGQLPDKGRDYLARITAAAARMQMLITGVLSLARVTADGAPQGSVNLGTVVAEVVADFDEALSRSRGQVEIGPLPSVAADPTLMRQLFHNLIGNGLKFRGAAPPRLRITATERSGAIGSPARTTWQIVVADNGIGFEPAYAERIFLPFERLHGRDVYDGTGIGLALCRRIVLRHGGSISAEGVPGGGARFIIHLPAFLKEIQ